MEYVLLLIPVVFLVGSVALAVWAVKKGTKTSKAACTQMLSFLFVCILTFDVPMIASAAQTPDAAPAAEETTTSDAAPADNSKGMGLIAAALVTGLAGIGGGIVMEGDLYRGSHYRAGEFGVLPVGNEGEPMHEVASASGLMKACRRALAVSEDEMPDGEELFKRMDSDVHLREAIEAWAHCLSRGIYSVISMFDPQAVLIGGGISEQEKIYLLLDKYLQRFEEWEALRVPILPCELGNQAGRLGAVWLAKQKQARSA